MNNKFVVISDGSCDLTDDEIRDLDITYVPFYVTFDGKNYMKEKVDISAPDFYQKMIDNQKVYPKSSTPTTVDYENAFMPFVEANMPVLCLCITSKFSASYSTAMLAKQTILEKHKDAIIEVLDTQVNTVLQGLLVEETCKLRDAGKTLEEALAIIKTKIPTGRIFFTIGNLDYLNKGGGIGKLALIIGDKLHIRPMIELKNGDISARGITFTRNRSILKVLSLAKKYFEDHAYDYKNYRFVVGYGNDCEEGKNFLSKVQELFKDISVKLEQIGATISVHTGPNPLGLAFIEKF